MLEERYSPQPNSKNVYGHYIYEEKKQSIPQYLAWRFTNHT